MRTTTHTTRSFARRWLLAGLTAVGVAAIVPAPASAAPAFDFVPGTAKIELLDGQGGPMHQAGAHPDLRVAFDLTTTEPDEAGRITPTESLRSVETVLPPGILGSLNAGPVCNGTARDTALDCPMDTAVGYGIVRLALTPVPPAAITPATVLVHRLPAPEGVAARFGFWFINISVIIDARVTADGGYRLTSNVEGISTASAIFSQELTLWGVPADHNGPGPMASIMNRSFGGPGTGPRKPFMWAPTRCDGPIDGLLRIRSWHQPDRWVTATPRISDGLTGCDQLPFAPKLSVQAESPAAGQPSGYAIDLELPQHEGPDDLITSQLKDATVTLPEGVAISPGRARGLDVCTDAQLGEGSVEAEQCPPSSRIGEVRIDSPLLPDPLTGTVYMGEQRSQDPASGEMYRMFMAVYDPDSGVRIKLRGQVKADPVTGQLTTTFPDNPELPFSKLSMRLDGGPHAALVNPPTCGTKTASLAATAWSGPTTSADGSFAIDHECGSAGFDLGLSAGTANPLAGQFSPFAMTLTRPDGAQDLSRVNLALPSGLLGALGNVPLCPEAQMAAGSCDASSRLGSVTVAAGSGPAPYALDGQVFVGGPYRGAPFSLSFVVPAKAGPFDLGTVVVRAALRVDANAGQATVESDPLPTIVGGVPLHVQRLQVMMDRPGFMFNATSCQPQHIGGELVSAAGAIARPTLIYQAQGCDRVPLRPKLSMEITGTTQLRAKGAPGIEAEMTQGFGESGLKQVQVTLPPSLALNTTNSNKPGALCEPAQAAARSCPESTRIGWAEAETPALHEPLKGPVYFVRGERTVNGRTIPTLPGLYVKLEGQGVPLDLRATSSVTSSRPQLLVATFDDIPDAPVKRFRISLEAGQGSVLQTANGVCPQQKVTRVRYRGHTGGEHRAQFRATAPGCRFRIDSTTRSQRQVGARVTGIGPGTLRLSGRGLTSSRRTIRAADTAQITARLSRASQRTLASGRSVRVTLRVRFAPKDGTARTVTRTVTVRPAER